MDSNNEKLKLINKLQRDIDQLNNDILDREFLRQEHIDDLNLIDQMDVECAIKIEELKAVIAILERE
jgi:hypothetical protein